MARRLIGCILLCIMLCTLFSTVYADGVSLYADEIFMSVTANLKSSKITVFTCATIRYANEIKITSCELQQKIKESWVTICSLPAPDTVTHNTIGYGSYMDYSSYITEAGTYRISFTADADGHSITRYSNERTFSN